MGKQVTHLIVGLGKGGAETMLYQVLKYQTDPSIQYKVISLGASHYYEKPIQNLGIEMVEIDIRKRPLSSLIKVFQEIKGSDVLFCWMYHSNLIGYYLGRFARVNRIIWSIHHSDLSREHNSRLSLWINRQCARISNRISLIVYTGKVARHIHEDCGYSEKNGIVLSNGCDCNQFSPNGFSRGSVRNEFGIPQDKKIIFSVTKDTPIKDIPNFIHAFSMLHREDRQTVAIMCGSGVVSDNKNIVSLCKDEGLLVGEDIYLIGIRNDISRLLAGCDVYVLHSAGEAFPVTLIEAMSCGCICVATDVGDVRNILDDDAWVVPAKDSKKLCLVIERAISLSNEEQQKNSIRNREIAIKNYSIDETVRKYEELY